jgi:DNA-binding transcriptional LysR family regulator
MRRYADGWLGRVRIGTSMTVLMYLLPPILRELKRAYPQLEISLKAGLTSTTLQLLKTNELDLGLCAMPIADPAFETLSRCSGMSSSPFCRLRSDPCQKR